MPTTRVAPALVAASLAAPLAALPLAPASAAEPSPHGKLAHRELSRAIFEGAATPTAAKPSLRLAAAAGTAADLDCQAYSDDQVVRLADRTVFRIAPVGASAVTIDRKNYMGATTRLATSLPGSRTEFADTRTSPGPGPTYALTFAFPDSTSATCSVDAARPVEDLVVGSGITGQMGARSEASNASSLATRDSIEPAFSPDGRWIGYSVPSAEGDLDLYIRRADGTGRGLALPSTGGDDVEIAFAWNGRHAAYSQYDYTTGASRLMLVDLNTGSQRIIPNSADLAEPAWLADGRLLATDYASADAGIEFINTSTGARTTLAGSAGGWSPDAAADGTIAYATFDQANEVAQVKVVRAGTTTVTESLEPGLSLFDVRLTARPGHSDVYFVAGALDVDQTTGEITGSTELRRDSVTGESRTDSTSVAGSQPMEMLTSLDVRAPKSAGTSDFTGDRRNDVLARDRHGVLWVYPGAEPATSQVTLGSPVRVGGGWQTMNAFVAAGDMTSDGRADVLARDGSGVLWLYPGTGSTSPVLGTRAKVSGGWGGYVIVAGGDYNGDLSADILARDSAGTLWVYPGTGTGGLGSAALGPRTRVGGGWNAMNALAAVGDATYDGVPDLFARDRSTGVGYLYPGTGAGTFGTRRSLGHGWPQTAFVGIENHPGEDDFVGLVSRMADGGLSVKRFWGDGAPEAGDWLISRGWNPYTITG
jgi:hypothetical protein